jgi:hypothetical protein
MRWHKECVHENDRVMVHSSDGEAWKMFNSFDANSFSSYTSFHRKRKIIEELLGKNSSEYMVLVSNIWGVQHMGSGRQTQLGRVTKPHLSIPSSGLGLVGQN